MASGASQEDITLAGEQGIVVAVRVRPLNERESRPTWRPLPQYNAITQLGADGEPLHGTNAVFNVDQVFDDSATTKQLYDKVCKNIVHGVISGINGTVFAYGQTSSGKTFTMAGTSSDSGVVQLAAEDIFTQISTMADRDFLLRVAYMEIYNENIRDLLSDDGSAPAHIREDPTRGVFIETREEVITSYEGIQQALSRGEKYRTTGATAMNERSSRSHAIFKLIMESKSKNEHNEISIRAAALNLVDLAGSESVRNTGATGQRAKEGGKINQSLLTLSRVIQQLGDKVQHVNFRDSKLTRLLQPMLQGNAAMAMICCVTPAEQFAEETRSTLQFASRAKRVLLAPEINEVLDKDSQLKKLKRELAELKARQACLSSGQSSGGAAEHNTQLQEQLKQQQLEIERYQRLLNSQVEADIKQGAEEQDEDARSRRTKRQRETWCPGERGLPLLASPSDHLKYVIFYAPGPAQT